MEFTKEEKIYLAREWANDALNIHVRDSVGAQHAAQLILELTSSLTGTDDIDYDQKLTVRGLSEKEVAVVLEKCERETTAVGVGYEDYLKGLRLLKFRGWTTNHFEGTAESDKALREARDEIDRIGRRPRGRWQEAKAHQDHDSMPFDVTVNGWVDDMIDPEVRM